MKYYHRILISAWLWAGMACYALADNANCIDSKGAIPACAQAAFDLADQGMNAAFKQALNCLPQDRQNALRNEQRDWIASRNVQSGFSPDTAGIKPIDYAALAKITNARMVTLTKVLEDCHAHPINPLPPASLPPTPTHSDQPTIFLQQEGIKVVEQGGPAPTVDPRLSQSDDRALQHALRDALIPCAKAHRQQHKDYYSQYTTPRQTRFFPIIHVAFNGTVVPQVTNIELLKVWTDAPQNLPLNCTAAAQAAVDEWYKGVEHTARTGQYTPGYDVFILSDAAAKGDAAVAEESKAFFARNPSQLAMNVTYAPPHVKRDSFFPLTLRFKNTASLPLQLTLYCGDKSHIMGLATSSPLVSLREPEYGTCAGPHNVNNLTVPPTGDAVMVTVEAHIDPGAPLGVLNFTLQLQQNGLNIASNAIQVVVEPRAQ